MKKVGKKARLRLLFLTLVILGLATYMTTTVVKDWRQILKNRHESKQLANDYQELLKEEEKLNSEVNKLSDPDYIARYAREKFLYSLPDEIIIRKN